MYTTCIQRDGDLWVAFHPELDGCIAQGETAGKAVEALNRVSVAYIAHLQEHGLPVPLPAWQTTYTGNAPSPVWRVEFLPGIGQQE